MTEKREWKVGYERKGAKDEDERHEEGACRRRRLSEAFALMALVPLHVCMQHNVGVDFLPQAVDQELFNRLE